jgi:hypothetical protein
MAHKIYSTSKVPHQKKRKKKERKKKEKKKEKKRKKKGETIFTYFPEIILHVYKFKIHAVI